MRRGDIRNICVDDRSFSVSFLGRGRHCTAFLEDINCKKVVWCFVKEDEYMKECVELWCHRMAHIPLVVSRGWQLIHSRVVKIYSMPYYPDITASNKEAWGVYKVLDKTSRQLFADKYCWQKPLPIYGCEYNRDIIDKTEGLVPKSVTAALQELADAAINYGSSVSFEFGKRNLGMDSRSRIVFRDVLFDAEKLDRELEKQRRLGRLR